MEAVASRLNRALILSKEQMPSVTLHLALADRVLERWLDAPQEAPFDPNDSTHTNAFFQGAFGPDLGYFPGGRKLLSELSHLVRSGDLTRALVRGARTSVERAYSWGWVTHVIADQRIHPLVGRAVGEFVYGDREVFADGARHQEAHVQIETGLDAFYSRLFPDLRKRKMAPVFNRESIGFLENAYRKVYGLTLSPSVFLASHLATAKKSVQGLVTIGILSTNLITRPVSPSFAGARWVLQGAIALMKKSLGIGSLTAAFLNPTPPAGWLVEEVGEEFDSFADRFFHHYRTDLEELENYNLDTGLVEANPSAHPGTQEALRALDFEGGRIPHDWADRKGLAPDFETTGSKAYG
jgi:hypothetical protein